MTCHRPRRARRRCQCQPISVRGTSFCWTCRSCTRTSPFIAAQATPPRRAIVAARCPAVSSSTVGGHGSRPTRSAHPFRPPADAGRRAVAGCVCAPAPMVCASRPSSSCGAGTPGRRSRWKWWSTVSARGWFRAAGARRPSRSAPGGKTAVTCHGLFPPPVIRVLSSERTDDEGGTTDRGADHRPPAGAWSSDTLTARTALICAAGTGCRKGRVSAWKAK